MFVNTLTAGPCVRTLAAATPLPPVPVPSPRHPQHPQQGSRSARRSAAPRSSLSDRSLRLFRRPRRDVRRPRRKSSGAARLDPITKALTKGVSWLASYPPSAVRPCVDASDLSADLFELERSSAVAVDRRAQGCPQPLRYHSDMDANKVVYQTATGDNPRGVYSNAGVKKLYPNYFKN